MTETNAKVNTEFDTLVNDYFMAWFRFHPETAVDCGQPHAGALTPFSNNDMGALLTLHDNVLNTLEEVDYHQLDADRKMDFDALIGHAYLERDALLRFDWRVLNPQRYLPFNALNQLLQRSVKGFARALSSRLTAVPDYLWQAQQVLQRQPERIVSEWLEQAIHSAQAGDDFMRSLSAHPKVANAIDRGPTLQLEIEAATKAVRAYARFLQEEIGTAAQGEFACGAHRFNKLMQLKHGLEIDHRQLYDFGVKLVETTREQLRQLCLQIAGHENISELSARLGDTHPAGNALVSVYQDAMLAAKNHVIDNDLVSCASAQRLEVVATPAYLRPQIPFAAYVPPMVGDPEQVGYYYVTDSSDDASRARHNLLDIDHTCVHEAYPGHHLQFTRANLDPRSATWPRLINTSATLYEGWALYCEQLMVEEKYLGQPLNEFVLLKDRLWRALRVLIDVDLHVHNMSKQQAAKQLCERLGLTPSQALADVSWYTAAPTVPMSYALGWGMINALRDQRMRQQSFKLKQFHDQLLACGSVSLAQVIKRQFGSEALAGVFRDITGG